MNAIDIPAIRGTLGKLTFYTATFTFKQIAERVKPADDEIHMIYQYLLVQVQQHLDVAQQTREDE